MLQVTESRVSAQGTEYGIALDKCEPEITLLIALFEPGECLILVAETNVNFRKVGGRYIVALRQLVQIRKYLASIRRTAHSTVNVTHRRDGFCR